MSIGKGMTDLGGIGKDQQQVYYIWRAIFTASTKRTQKVLYLTKTNKQRPDIVVAMSSVTKTLGKAAGDLWVHLRALYHVH